MYNIGSAFHAACLLLHFPLLLSAPAFSTLAFLTILHFPLPHFQLPRVNISSDVRNGHLLMNDGLIVLSCMCICLLCFAAILSLVGVIIFGWQFYGDLDVSPFGWSFGLTIVGIIFFLLNGVMLVLHTIFIHMYVSSARNRNRTQPTSCWGQLTNCLQGCLQGI